MIQVLGIAHWVVPTGLGEADVVVRPDEPPDLVPDLVEHVPPAPPVVGPEGLGLLLVHLQILSEDGLAGHDPGPAPVPPLPDGASGGGPDGGDGPRPAEQVPRGGGRRLDLEGQGGEPPAEAPLEGVEAAVLMLRCSLGDREGRGGGREVGDEAPLLHRGVGYGGARAPEEGRTNDDDEWKEMAMEEAQREGERERGDHSLHHGLVFIRHFCGSHTVGVAVARGVHRSYAGELMLVT